MLAMNYPLSAHSSQVLGMRCKCIDLLGFSIVPHAARISLSRDSSVPFDNPRLNPPYLEPISEYPLDNIRNIDSRGLGLSGDQNRNICLHDLLGSLTSKFLNWYSSFCRICED